MESLYAQIENAIRSHTSVLSVLDNATQDDVYQAILDILRNNPDIFWFSHQWHYTENDCTIRFQYTLNMERSKKIRKQIDDVLENDFHIHAVSQLSEPEKVMYVYKWLAGYCKYNVYSAFNQTICSVFVYRNSVCTGFAKAAQYLFKLLGIESRLLFGEMHYAEAGSRHCWLLVKVCGQWYHFDPTFAVPEISDMLRKSGVEPLFGVEGLVYNYFCCDLETIKRSRTIEDESALPVCNDVIDFRSLQGIPICRHRPLENGQYGVRGCLLNDVGRFSNVYLWHAADGPQKVVKQYKRDSSHLLIRQEFDFMQELSSSPHVIRSYGITRDGKGLLMEQATPLTDLLCSHYYQLSAVDFCKLLMDVLDALQDCIDHKIYYRDIHLNNIFMNSKGRYVLGDFGSCIWIAKDNQSSIGGVASLWYMAPETYCKNSFDETSAVYEVGMLAYFLLNDFVPPLWKKFGDEAWNVRVRGMIQELPPPLLLENATRVFEQYLVSVIKRALSYASDLRFPKLSDLKKALEKCVLLVRDDDYLLIDGGTAERMDEVYNGEEIVKTDFHSTGSPGMLVSNGASDSKPFLNDAKLDSDDETGALLPKSCPEPSSYPGRGTNRINRINRFATTRNPYLCDGNERNTYLPKYNSLRPSKNASRHSVWSRLFQKKESAGDEVYSSVFAPAEMRPKSHLLVQVYLHLLEESEIVAQLAVESDKEAQRRDYIPLQIRLKTGDAVDVEMNVYGDTLLFNDRKTIRWQGKFTKCSFDYFVSDRFIFDELNCEINLYVNGALVGDMRFITKIVNQPRQLNSEIVSRAFKHIFISYAHQDSKRVKGFALAYRAQGVDYFFDRDKLAAGDVYEEKIFEYIDSADLFILCWSVNAASSEYVGKERKRAMLRAYPQRSIGEATLKIYPISIEPRTEPPDDMVKIYNFEEV